MCSWATRHSFSSVTLSVLSSTVATEFQLRDSAQWGCFASPVPPSLFFLLFYQCNGCLLSPFRVGAHDWVANSGSSWMPEAPNLHFVRQLLNFLLNVNQFYFYLFLLDTRESQKVNQKQNIGFLLLIHC